VSDEHNTASISKGVSFGMGAGALWGLVFLAPELARDFSPLQLTIGRYFFYGVFSALLIWPQRQIFARIKRREWFALIWLSLAGNTLYYILLSSAVQLGGIAMTSLVIGFLPVAVTIIGSRDRGAVPLQRLAPSLLLCVGGAICIGWQALVLPASGSVKTQLAALLCAIGALVSWTSYAVGNQRWLIRLDDVSAQQWNLLTGIVTGAQALLLIPLTMAFSHGHHDELTWLRFIGISMGVATFASIVGNTLWNRMSQILPLTLVGQMILFETLFALIYGFVWEQRLPTVPETVAFMFVVTSVFSCITAHQKRLSIVLAPQS
jgi:drug/metabolite transporter (DMT)-like permease